MAMTRRQGITNRRKQNPKTQESRPNTRLSCKIEYLQSLNYGHASIASEFFTGDGVERYARRAMISSVPIIRHQWQRRDLDAFLHQGARFVGRGLAVDRAMLDFAIMHLAGFVGKTARPTLSELLTM